GQVLPAGRQRPPRLRLQPLDPSAPPLGLLLQLAPGGRHLDQPAPHRPQVLLLPRVGVVQDLPRVLGAVERGARPRLEPSLDPPPDTQRFPSVARLASCVSRDPRPPYALRITH